MRIKQQSVQVFRSPIMIEFLPVFLITQFYKQSPGNVAKIVKITMLSAYAKFNLPKIVTTMEDDRVEQITRYIPVAEATCGLSPIQTYIEFKIRPTPNPNPPAANPVKNPINRSLVTIPGLHYKSPSTNGYPIDSLSLCSFLSIIMPIIVRINPIAHKRANKNQSTGEHFITPAIPPSPFPLINDKISKDIIIMKLSNNFFH